MEHKFPIGLVRDVKTESAAGAAVEHQHLLQLINEPNSRGRVTFSDIARHYVKSELPELPRPHTCTATSRMIS
jgi:hypothetical protein